MDAKGLICQSKSRFVNPRALDAISPQYTHTDGHMQYYTASLACRQAKKRAGGIRILTAQQHSGAIEPTFNTAANIMKHAKARMILLTVVLLLLVRPTDSFLVDAITSVYRFLFCPGIQFDLKFYFIGWRFLFGLESYYETLVKPALESGSDGILDGLGSCERTSVTHAAVSADLQTMVSSLDSGLSYRTNSLGVLRMNELPFFCSGLFQSTPFSDGYCGITLGMPVNDHTVVRPALDEILGTSSEGFLDEGNRWTLESLRDSAANFLADRSAVTFPQDASVWVTQTLHEIVFDITLSTEEANLFVANAASFFLAGVIPFRLYGLNIGGTSELKHFRSDFQTRYETSLRQQIQANKLTSLPDKTIQMTARALFDAFTYAAVPSVGSTLQAFLAAYYSDLFDSDLEITNTLQTSAQIMETIRRYPPVGGVSYIEKDTKLRRTPHVASSGFDETVYGADFLDFRVRLSLDDYQNTLLNWSNAATDGSAGSSYVCPAKSLSFNMILAFLQALDPVASWDVNSVPGKGTGPDPWESFVLNRR